MKVKPRKRNQNNETSLLSIVEGRSHAYQGTKTAQKGCLIHTLPHTSFYQ